MTPSLQQYLLLRKTGETMNYKDFQKQVDFLLDNASPNILYRVKKEILDEAIDSPEMMELQAKILTLPKVKKAFACQRENGFLAPFFTEFTLMGLTQQ